jgi:uncharacterized protein (TIGR00251 family)
VDPYRWTGADLELRLHAQPGAKRAQVKGTHAGAIRIGISARPVEGAANEALVEFLADAFQVPRRRCILISGKTSRHKRVRIESPDRTHADRVLESWLLRAAAPGS